jgi:pimeloyl-ACP methyl ester carboxylesterase
MTDDDELPLILLPGIGTDARLFSLQRLEFPQLVIPEWLPPQRRESLTDYAARFAETVNPGRPCIVGGMSFGGIVALELSRHLPAVACVLISSVKSSLEFPLWMRVLGPWAWVLPRRTDLIVAAMGTALNYSLGFALPPRGRQFCEHLSKTRSLVLPWACRVAVKWRPTLDGLPCPVFHLHGDCDPIFPLRFTKADQVIAGGGHALPLTHPYVVNQFLKDCVERIRTPAGAPECSR